MYQPGEVFLVPFPFSSMQASKKRPVLALTPPDTFEDMVCLAITSSPLHHAHSRSTMNVLWKAYCQSPAGSGWIRFTH